MTKIRILYIFSIVLLGFLVAFGALLPFIEERQHSVVQKEGLIKYKDGWVLNFNILNKGRSDTRYTIDVVVDGELSTMTVSVAKGAVFNYSKRIESSVLTAGEVRLAIYKEGDSAPLENVTYHIK